MPPSARNPVRKVVLIGLLVAMAWATSAVWSQDDHDRSPIVVVESGFRFVTERGDDHVAWVAIAENTGDEAVDNALLRFTYHDDDGARDDSEFSALETLQPGERRAHVGTHSMRELEGHRSSGDGLSGPPVDMAVYLDHLDNVSADRRPPTDIPVGDIWVGRSEEELSVAVDLEEDIVPGSTSLRVLLIFRDADDQIIGGRRRVPLNLGAPVPSDQTPRSFLTLEADEIPDDLATIEVHVQDLPY